MQFEPIFALGISVVGLVFIVVLYQSLNKKWSLAEKKAFVSTCITLGVTVSLAFLCRIWAISYLVYIAVIPVVLALLTSGIALWRAFLIRREEEEAEDRADVLGEAGRLDLFDDTESVMKASEIARKQFDKWAIPAFTVLMGGGLLLTAWMVLAHYRGLTGGASAEALQGMLDYRKTMDTLGFSVGFMVACSLLGVYYNGISRQNIYRYMRPVGQWLIFAGIIFAIATGLMGLEYVSEHKEDMTSTRMWDIYVAMGVLYVVMAFGIQMMFNFIIEFYRPRTKKEQRPLFESRLLAIITEPGSIAANVSQTLEYQFGVKVSETWFYKFVLKAALPYMLLLVVLLYALDCFVYVRHHEMGVAMRFGAYHKVVSPGLHLKLPRPLDDVRKFPVKRVNRLDIGFKKFDSQEEMQRAAGDNPDMEEKLGDPTGRVIVWSKHHFKEEIHYITAARSGESSKNDAESVDEDRAPVIDYLSASIIVHYKIGEDEKSVEAFFLNYENPERVLKDVIRREVVRYLASADLLQVISSGNQETQKELFARIRNSVEALPKSLGVEIVHFAMAGVHPPVEVAESFQNIITGLQAKKTLEHQAWSIYHNDVESAKGEADLLISRAESYKFEKETVPITEIAQFEAQLTSYRIAPEVFKMRYFLSEMEELWESPELWKFIVATPSANSRTTDIRYREPRPDIGDFDTEKPEE